MNFPNEAQRRQDETLADEAIVTRVVAGEIALFELLMRRHNQRVYRTIRSVIRNEAEVEDAMQQTYVNAYRNLAQFAGDAKFSTWLLKIALHEAFARRRRKSFVIAESDCGEPCEDAMSNVESSSQTPEADAANAELKAILERHIADLHENYRVVFVMRDVEGLSTEETAQALDVSTDVVKTRLHRARTMLRDALVAKAGLTADQLFEFRDTRCSRVVNAVMAEITRA
jgi:RNA polymerase sigma-70 factor (ECF subfamily)